jgi:hypothetical protein
MAKRKAGRKAKKTGTQDTKKLVKLLRLWQEIEDASIESTAKVIRKSKNPLVREIMEIIRNDSIQHRRVQQFIIDGLTKSPVQLTPEELEEVWDEIVKHDDMEKAAMNLGKQLRQACHSIVERTLLDYLFVDEEKHDTLLRKLEDISTELHQDG